MTLANWRKPPYNRWAFQHVREIIPSAEIATDPDNIRPLPSADRDFSSLSIEFSGKSYDMSSFLLTTDTDALVVVQDGQLIFEYYANGTTAMTQHIFMSVSKSVLGLVMGILIAQGLIDPERAVAEWIPEIGSSAYAGASIRDLLDMRAGILFDEDYLASAGPIIEYRKAQGWDPLAPSDPPMDLRGFYPLLSEADGPHGGPMHYVSPSTDLLGWVIERATGRRYADLVSEFIWRPIGSERDAYITVDRLGAPRCAGGFCATARDLARFGLLMIEGGRRDGSQIVPKSWIDDIFHGGDASAWQAGDFAKYFPGLTMHYRNKWYVFHGEQPMAFAVGVFGQNVFCDPANRLIIAKFSSQELPMDEERISLTVVGVQKIREHVSTTTD